MLKTRRIPRHGFSLRLVVLLWNSLCGVKCGGTFRIRRNWWWEYQRQPTITRRCLVMVILFACIGRKCTENMFSTFIYVLQWATREQELCQGLSLGSNPFICYPMNPCFWVRRVGSFTHSHMHLFIWLTTAVVPRQSTLYKLLERNSMNSCLQQPHGWNLRISSWVRQPSPQKDMPGMYSLISGY